MVTDICCSVASHLVEVGTFAVSGWDCHMTVSVPEELDLKASSPLYILNVVPTVVDKVRQYLENKDYGGGKVLDFQYDESSNSACVTFADYRG